MENEKNNDAEMLERISLMLAEVTPENAPDEWTEEDALRAVLEELRHLRWTAYCAKVTDEHARDRDGFELLYHATHWDELEKAISDPRVQKLKLYDFYLDPEGDRRRMAERIIDATWKANRQRAVALASAESNGNQ